MNKVISSTWFKCISVLLTIALIAGGLLAILNDVLYVSPSERTMRAIEKIYGEEKEYSVVLDVDGTDESKKNPVVCSDYGVIEKIFTVGDISSQSFDILFRATGNHGYKEGTITLWIKVSVNSGNYRIDKTILETFTKQTLMSKLGDYYGTFDDDIIGKYYSPKEKDKDKTNIIYAPVSGATKSATATCNAVNCVIYYLTEVA